MNKTMSPNEKKPQAKSRVPKALPWVVVGMLILGLLAAMPAAWARPSQSPDFQTVPTLTPTEPSAGNTPTPEPGEPTDTPSPVQATDTPTPSDTPGPGTPTAAATQTPTSGATPTGTASPTPTDTAVPTAPAVTAPAQCWTAPTPGFQPVPAVPSIDFKASGGQPLVVPGQTLKLQLAVTNKGKATLKNVLVCNPLYPGLTVGLRKASQGQVKVDAKGLIATLGDLPAGKTATVDVDLTIPASQPLGGVIENQAWLFSNGQAASTALLTWALPPAWLPPTGK